MSLTFESGLLSTTRRLRWSSFSSPDSMVPNHSLWQLWMNCSIEFKVKVKLVSTSSASGTSGRV